MAHSPVFRWTATHSNTLVAPFLHLVMIGSTAWFGPQLGNSPKYTL